MPVAKIAPVPRKAVGCCGSVGHGRRTNALDAGQGWVRPPWGNTGITVARVEKTMNIESGIPIRKSYGPRTEVGRIAREMKQGDSVLCTTLTERDVLRRTLHNLHGKPITRKEVDGWRVWRTA